MTVDRATIARMEAKTGRKAVEQSTPQVVKENLATAKPNRGMNEWESDYAQQLELMRMGREIKWYAFEFLKFKLAGGAWFTPDFAVVYRDGRMELHEVKGHWREAAKLRVKVFRDRYPHWPLRVFRKVRGEWTEDLIASATGAAE